MPIENFGWQITTLEEQPSPTVGIAVALARAARAPFVLFDPDHGESALVVPQELETLVARLKLSLDDSLRGTGLFALLRRHQLKFTGTEPAHRALNTMRTTSAYAGLVVDDRGRPQRLVVPETLRRRLGETHTVRSSEALSREIESAVRKDDLAAAVSAIERLQADFHSELVNEHNPDILICGGDGGHAVSLCPCTDVNHRNMGCGPQTVR